MQFPEPFGGILFLLAIAGLILAGCIVAIRGAIKSSGHTALLGGAMIGLPIIATIYFLLFPWGIDEWNPIIESDSQVCGTWKTDNYNVTLTLNGKYITVQHGLQLSGSWRRDDWNLYLYNSSGDEKYMRFVEDSGELKLLVEPGSAVDEIGPIATRQ